MMPQKSNLTTNQSFAAESDGFKNYPIMINVWKSNTTVKKLRRLTRIFTKTCPSINSNWLIFAEKYIKSSISFT